MFSPGGSFKPRFRYPHRQPSQKRIPIVPNLTSESSSGSSLSQSDLSKTGSVQISPIARYEVASPLRISKDVSFQSFVERIRSSPLAQLVVGAENVSPDEDTPESAAIPTEISTKKVVGQRGSPQKRSPSAPVSRSPPRKVQVTPANEGMPGDMSTTYLASTPKPGRPQFTRKSANQKKAKSTVRQTTKKSGVKGSTVKETSTSVLHKDRRVLRSSDTSIPKLRQTKMSDIYTTPQLPPVAKEKAPKTRQVLSQLGQLATLNAHEKTTSATSAGPQSRKKSSTKKTTKSPVVKETPLSASRGLTSMSIAEDIVPVTRTRTKRETGSKVPGQAVKMWVGEDSSRTRGDLLDLDVVLNSICDTCAAEQDLCETNNEKKAVTCMKQYLTDSITSMIKDAQLVRTLQAQVRMKNSNVKKKKERFFHLQQERLALDQLSEPVREKKQQTENMIEINAFLTELKNVFTRC